MYAKFYGFDRLAFQLTPDPSFFYDSAEHQRAMAHLNYGLHNAEGFIVITGEVGAGKTMLVDRLLSQIDPQSFVTAKIVTSQLGGDDLLRMVVSAFGLDHVGLPKAGLLDRVQDFVLSQSAARRRAVLIIDEAQNLSLEALEELRMLSNIVVGTEMALQSFLLGQPQFRTILGNPALEQLRQRITAAYHLRPLSETDTQAYIEHRMRCAGWTGDPQFVEGCFGAIFRHTGGVPRRINTLCSRILLFGMLEGIHAIAATTVDDVAADLESELSTVVSPANASAPSVLTQDAPLLEMIVERLDSLDRVTTRHTRTLKRMVDIMIKYVEETEADDRR
jgi:putative secretion ATPase (PEP-CTERM system associated)